MLVGYARVSTHEQNLTLQTDALKQAGCQRIFDDKVSGVSSERPGLKAALEYVREGDTLLVWRLDRLGCSLKDLIEIIGSLEKRGVGFKSLQESIDTTTSGGRLIFHAFGLLAEFERDLIRERTRAGLEALAHEDAKVADRGLLMARRWDWPTGCMMRGSTPSKGSARCWGKLVLLSENRAICWSKRRPLWILCLNFGNRKQGHPADLQWLREVEATFEECYLVPMTPAGERGIACQMQIEPGSLPYLRRFPGEKAASIQQALEPLLVNLPGPIFTLGWDEEARVWRSRFAHFADDYETSSAGNPPLKRAVRYALHHKGS